MRRAIGRFKLDWNGMMKVGATTKNLGKFDSRLESGIIGG